MCEVGMLMSDGFKLSVDENSNWCKIVTTSMSFVSDLYHQCKISTNHA